MLLLKNIIILILLSFKTYVCWPLSSSSSSSLSLFQWSSLFNPFQSSLSLSSKTTTTTTATTVDASNREQPSLPTPSSLLSTSTSSSISETNEVPRIFDENHQTSIYSFSIDESNDTITNNFNHDQSFNESSSELSFEYLISQNQHKSHEVKALLRNDKTMADLILDYRRRDIVYCELFDLERDPAPVRLPSVLSHRHSLVVSHKFMMKIVRKCTHLALSQHSDVFSRNDRSSTSTTVFDVAENQHNHNHHHDDISILSNSTYRLPPLQFDMNLQHYWTFWRGILPGTKWCGLGDVASEYEDLGPKLDIDLCCRAHDHCPIRLKAFRSGYGVRNFSFYSRLHCECDLDFYYCLKKSPNSYATMLGQFYFNVLRLYCLNDVDPKTMTSPTPISTSEMISIHDYDLDLSKLLCKKHRITPEGIYECIDYGQITDAIINEKNNSKLKMNIVPFGKSF